MVRLRALFRRMMRHQFPPQKVIETANFMIDQEKREVLVQKTQEGEIELVTLSLVEFDLLSLMANRPGRVWTRVELLDTVKGFDFIGEERAIDTYIKRLRKKISPANDRDRFIRTHIGVGYSFEDRA